MKKTEYSIGAHVSTSGGLVQALYNGRALGASCIQIFGSSPVRWNAPMPSEEVCSEFKREREAVGMQHVFLHAPYLINLASEKEHIRKLSEKLLEDNLKISNAIGADGVIFHTGSAGAQKKEDALKIAVQAIRNILQRVSRGRLLVENSAGAGNLIGDTIEEIAEMIKGVASSRFVFCLDTAHAYASQIISAYTPQGVNQFEQDILQNLGKNALQAIHVNDSKVPAGSKKDRHENIGEGYIGREGFVNLFSLPFFKERPLILEVPGEDGHGPDIHNMQELIKIL